MIYRTGVNDYLKKIQDSNVSETDLGVYARGARNELIAITDWTQLPDNGLSEELREEWANYRQNLRDIPNQPGFPKSIVWPKNPTED